MEVQGVDEDQAALEVLGISYNELGLGIAKSWNFPESLISGMRIISSDKSIEPADNVGRLSVVVNMANELCSITSVTDPKAQKDALNKIQLRYSGVADASVEKLSSALTSSLQDLSQRSKVMGIDTAKNSVLKNIKQLVVNTVAYKNARKAEESALDASAPINEKSADHEDLEDKVDAEALLRAGLQDVTNTMQSEYKLNDLLQMVLETIYRGLGFKHVLIFSRDAKKI